MGELCNDEALALNDIPPEIDGRISRPNFSLRMGRVESGRGRRSDFWNRMVSLECKLWGLPQEKMLVFDGGVGVRDTTVHDWSRDSSDLISLGFWDMVWKEEW